MKLYRYVALGGMLLIVAGLLIGVTLAQEEEPNPHGDPPTFLRGIYDAWVNSGHADLEAEAFIHWNEDEEKVVPERCARCHSTPGYIDYMGDDGSEFGTIDAAAPLGTVINCDACHSPTAVSLREVTFPSGVELTDLGDSARCMVCHQGRSSANSVTSALEESGALTDMDAVNEDLRFINIHYYAAAASRYGGEVHGGYEYEGQVYQPRFVHTEGYDSCFDCHNPHTLELRIDECGTCHEDVDTVEDLYDTRMNGSLIDYDGDGDMEEGIKAELEGLQEMLYQAIQAYAAEVVGTPILYDSHSYPYFFSDLNGNGEVDGDDGRYSTFSGRLLQAVYNYQVSLKDPGAFAHNSKYHIELLYDSIASLNEALMEPVDLSTANRNDPGHFDSTGEPFRHWDEDEEVSGRCTRCHTADGLPFYLEHGVNISAEPANSLSCNTCHDDIGEFTLHVSNEVEFPSGATATFGEEEPSNLCINCHQGRESGVSVDRAIASAGVGDNEVSESLRFRNIHYFAAGATLFGNDVNGGYQYEGKDYSGRNTHSRKYTQCIDCHNEHSLTIRYDECSECHENVEVPDDVLAIRYEYDEDVEGVDYDGDGDNTEPVRDEIMTLHAALLDAIKAYALEQGLSPVTYDSHAYPYWFTDMDSDGMTGDDDVRYAEWTPSLLRAAYNYQYVAKDPGMFAHNPDYIIQLLYDSLEAIGGEEAVANFNRAPVRMDE